MQLKNCEVWADTLVHDISNSKIRLIQQNNSTASISWPGKEVRKLVLPKKAIFYIHPSCQLSTDSFTIGSIGYTHLADFESAELYEVGVELEDEVELSTRKPIQELENRLNLTRIDLDELAKENEAFGERLKELEIKHKELWEQASDGRTGTEQIIFY